MKYDLAVVEVTNAEVALTDVIAAWEQTKHTGVTAISTGNCTHRLIVNMRSVDGHHVDKIKELVSAIGYRPHADNIRYFVLTERIEDAREFI